MIDTCFLQNLNLIQEDFPAMPSFFN